MVDGWFSALGIMVRGLGFRIPDLRFSTIQGSGIGVWGSGFGVWGSGFGVWGSGFRI